MALGTSWFYTWLDEFDITSDDVFRKATDSPRALGRLEEIAHEELAIEKGQTYSKLSSLSSEDRLLAGQGYSLSLNSCGRIECLKREALDIASSSWPYFENVVVSGPAPSVVARRLQRDLKKNRRELISQLRAYTNLLNRIRDSGMERRFTFLPGAWESHLCTNCMQTFAEELGQSPEVHEKTRILVINELFKNAKIETRKSGSEWTSLVSHRLLEEPRFFHSSKRPTRREVCEQTYMRYYNESLHDHARSSRIGLPLAVNANAKWVSSSLSPAHPTSGDPRVGRIILEMQLPVIEGLTLDDLGRLIDADEPDAVKFQAALRAGIREQIEKFDTKSDAEIASIVHRDYIKPELAEIDRKLTRVRSLFSSKLGTGVAVGTMATTVGLVTSIPLIIATGVAATATVLPEAYKALNERSEVKTSDMYFMWKLANNRLKLPRA